MQILYRKHRNICCIISVKKLNLKKVNFQYNFAQLNEKDLKRY